MLENTYDKNGKLHSYDNKPAVVSEFGYSQWYKHGKLHCENDLPAHMGRKNHKEWWYEGRLHRDIGLAIQHSNGVMSWYKHGLYKFLFYDKKKFIIPSAGPINKEWQA